MLIWLDMEGVPAVDPSQGDLAAGQQGPEQHGRRFGCGQDALGLDPALELLVQARPISSNGGEKIVQDGPSFIKACDEAGLAVFELITAG